MSAKRAKQRDDSYRSGTPEWYTPAWLLARIAAFYGGAYFDPCPPSRGVVTETALTGSWRGQRAYVNPPYGKPIEAWIVKAMTEPVHEVILLVPANTAARWFAPLVQHTMCFLRRRVTFEVHGKGEKPAPHGSVLVYRGRRYKQFAEAFADLGPVLRTYQPYREKQPTLLVPPRDEVA